MNLQRFIDAKQEELRALRQHMPPPLPLRRPDFRAALLAPPPAGEPLRVIAEYKRRSPSLGLINESLGAQEVAAQYAAGGASCMSVLTEERFFGGQVGDLVAAAPAGLPLLRKDFIFDELQVRATWATPAAALLLIVALTPDVARLRGLRELAEEQGLHAVVEIFTERELELARESGARIVQVNARNLETLRTDRRAGLQLAAQRLPGECWIAASAMQTRSHLDEAAAAGYNAALVGTALMQGDSPLRNLRRLLHPESGCATSPS